MLDNFTVQQTKEVWNSSDVRKLKVVVITKETIVSYAECGVDFISVGALTHQIASLDLSLKACAEL